MRERVRFVVAAFVVSTLLSALQKPLFLLCNAADAAATTPAEWWGVVWHGLRLDLTVAGYITALPLLLVLVSVWVPLPVRALRRGAACYFGLVSFVVAATFAANLALYPYWGFPLDSTVLIYIVHPREAAASADGAAVVRTLLLFALCGGANWLAYRRLVLPHCDAGRRPVRQAGVWSVVLIVAAGLDFLAIRGGTGPSVANVSKVCFSTNQFLNHAAVNPAFSFLSTLGEGSDYGSEYPFFGEEELAARFEALRGDRSEGPAERLLRVDRPNVVVVILESFSRIVMEEEVGGRAVMPSMRAWRERGIWFENFFANSFRTDRGEVAILSGYPAQTRLSIMKLPAKSRSLPSMARSLGAAGYATRFVYGGDLDFTNQSSYMYATGWQELLWQKSLSFDRPPTVWGYDDAVMCDWFADRVIAWSAEPQPFLAGLLTLSSHEPFKVPFEKFDHPVLNAMAFSDDCVGRMLDRLAASPAWENLLVVLVADHSYPYPRTLNHSEPARHRIPMIWTGGAVAGPHRVETYGSQIDLCATLLGQLGIDHSDFVFSKDLFDPSLRKFAYYTFNEGFGVVDSEGEAVWDAASGVAASDGDLLDVGRTMLQATYVDIANR